MKIESMRPFGEDIANLLTMNSMRIVLKVEAHCNEDYTKKQNREATDA